MANASGNSYLDFLSGINPHVVVLGLTIMSALLTSFGEAYFSSFSFKWSLFYILLGSILYTVALTYNSNLDLKVQLNLLFVILVWTIINAVGTFSIYFVQLKTNANLHVDIKQAFELGLYFFIAVSAVFMLKLRSEKILGLE